MGFFKFFKSTKEDQSAKVAKDRLQVLIAHERTGRDGPDYLPMLKQDILDVIKKYVAVGDDAHRRWIWKSEKLKGAMQIAELCDTQTSIVFLRHSME